MEGTYNNNCYGTLSPLIFVGTNCVDPGINRVDHRLPACGLKIVAYKSQCPPAGENILDSSIWAGWLFL